MPWSVLALFDICLVGTVWAAYELTRSNTAQAIWMLLFIYGSAPLLARVRTQAFPLASDDVFRWGTVVRVLIIAAAGISSLALQWGLYRVLGSLSIYPGVWAFFCVGFLIPLGIILNKFGRQMPSA